MKYNLFDYLETSSKKEKDEIAEKLTALYLGSVKDENETFAAYMANKANGNAKAAYLESCQRLGAILDVFEVLGILPEKIREGGCL